MHCECVGVGRRERHVRMGVYLCEYVFSIHRIIGVCELFKAPSDREMLCERCECVSECEC